MINNRAAGGKQMEVRGYRGSEPYLVEIVGRVGIEYKVTRPRQGRKKKKQQNARQADRGDL